MKQHSVDMSNEKLQIGELSSKVSRVSGITGLLFLAAAAIFGLVLAEDATRFFASWLLSFVFFLSLSLGALFFVLIQHVTSASWSVVVRRLAEGIAGNFPVLLILFLPILGGMDLLYHWSDAEAVAHDSLLQWKEPYLNLPFFCARMAFYFLAWIAVSLYYRKTSIQQDASGDPALSIRMKRLAAPSLVIFALTATFVSVDLLMSLDAHWFSTMFGVYYFAGSFLSFLAALSILAVWLQERGFLVRTISIEHYHDIGKFSFAFVVFWAYIAFSQYMLIWYANVPEETTWFLARQTGQWEAWSWLLLFGHFVIPFLGLVSKRLKRRGRTLLPWAIWLLLMHWVDMFYLVMPVFGESGVLPLSILDALTFTGFAGLYVAGLFRTLGKSALIPLKDPRLQDSISFENA
ncbi:MAG: quinol:cytochrome C oxidoreductase [Candidatus Krumholzibacteria bacterium]|jgi:hypothetical protein|nr:quinol:cytochrome C oxidoreductase [Candidatus Krumholzibacteria bacterium]MDP6668606.1 quinol:cytochrome C oxidoreductase [Candidatus Krumholzibacteria bacterium]MDP6796323.1 quinol:cytochrome C oxidoreductase [Candidatus Krumholzibacteria bacterium]MDP7021326.1 quinol:cytochrome C oxidoreductase [Candidatus Krumholzibacteria bacterium]